MKTMWRIALQAMTTWLDSGIERWRTVMNSPKMKAVHQMDLHRFLDSLGLGQAFRTGQLYCLFCRTQVTDKNLGSVFPHDHEIHVSCDQIRCHQQLLDMKSGAQPVAR